jgi:ribosome maturation factor RimP
MRKIDPALHDRLLKLIESMGYDFVGGELTTQGSHALLRIYIDSKTGQAPDSAISQSGITVDDCSLVSHQVSAMLDVEDPIQGHYTLEVSSPGIDRPLFELEHYNKYIGQLVKIRLYAPVNKRRQYKGTLTRVLGENIYLLVDNTTQEIELPFALVEKANLIGDI